MSENHGVPEPLGEMPAGGIEADLLGGFAEHLTPIGIAALIADLRWSLAAGETDSPRAAADAAYLEVVIAALYEAGDALCGTEELEESIAWAERQLYV